MEILKKLRVRTFWPALVWSIIATALFCMPGEEFPEAGWLDLLHIDKLIHIAFFVLFMLLWCLPLESRIHDENQRALRYIWIGLTFVVYGVAIEFVQKNFIPHRSFDFFDIVADAIGCIIGWVIVKYIPR